MYLSAAIQLGLQLGAWLNVAEQAHISAQFLDSVEMLRCICRNQLRSQTPGLKVILFDVQFLKSPNLRFASTTSDFTRDYLRNSCGLSSQTALYVSQKLFLKSTKQPNSVLNLFKDYGLSKPQITRLIAKYPLLLISDPEQNLKPKIDYIQSLGVSGPNLAHFISCHPSVLNGTLERFSCYQPRRLAVKVERFSETCNLLKEMGFDPSSTMFAEAARIMIGMSKEIWERKLTMYKELGWSKEDTLAMFKNCPNCMRFSEKKTRRAVEFYMNVLRLKPAEMSSNATLISLSMDKRILPRCAVLEVLNSAGVLRNLTVKSAIQISEKKFLEKYVTPYEERVPDVVKAYEGKIRFVGFSNVGAMLNEL